MDWITLSVESVGIVILLCWIVIPMGEFKQILAKLRPTSKRGPHEDEELLG